MLTLRLSIRSLIFLEKHSAMGWLILKLSAKKGGSMEPMEPPLVPPLIRGPNEQNMMLYILSTSE